MAGGSHEIIALLCSALLWLLLRWGLAETKNENRRVSCWWYFYVLSWCPCYTWSFVHEAKQASFMPHVDVKHLFFEFENAGRAWIHTGSVRMCCILDIRDHGSTNFLIHPIQWINHSVSKEEWWKESPSLNWAEGGGDEMSEQTDRKLWVYLKLWVWSACFHCLSCLAFTSKEQINQPIKSSGIVD